MSVLRVMVLADVDVDAIVTIVILALGGLYWLLKKLAEAKDQERQRPARNGKAVQEEDEGYAADNQEVQRFLESLGAKPDAAPRQPPPRPQPVRPPQRPPAPPRPAPEPKPAYTAAPQEEEQYVFGTQVAAPAAPRPTPLVRPAQRLGKLAPGRPAAEAARAKALLEDRLAFPRLSTMQRAIILSHLLERKRGPHKLLRR